MGREERQLIPLSRRMQAALIRSLGRAPRELLIIVALDAEGRFLTCQAICGSLGAAAAEYRSILGPAIAHEAHALILAHNHPSGIPCPSREDIVSTTALAALARPLRIEIADHFIVTSNSAFSMSQAGLLGQFA